jgi:hypothetical protein
MELTLSVLQPKSHVFPSHRRYAVFLQLLLPAIRKSSLGRIPVHCADYQSFPSLFLNTPSLGAVD